MAKSIFFFILHFTLFISTSSSNPTPLPTVHYVLTYHGFPVDLLPIDVLSYDLSRTSDEFGRPFRLILQRQLPRHLIEECHLCILSTVDLEIEFEVF
ncbi:hypothetical protein L1987_32758 [Smallanthus sonchifolius]|uniref:Uncharacterized protein n=1 Tax=Smallanthus sonchifolius TaxID=185202 RepID=A0ACB9HQI0_9ASTR|nr:hypothetical protein L1987_32758 [Smallanthus sonchifolius]